MNDLTTSADAPASGGPQWVENGLGAHDDADRTLAASELDNLLLSVIQALARCKDGPSIAATLAGTARKAMAADGITVVMRDDDRCRYLEEDAVGSLWKGQAFPMSECISGWCITNSQVVVIPDIRVDGRIPQRLYAATFVRSMAMAPIGREEPIGALGAYWSTVHDASDDEVRMLAALADAGALALHKLALLEKLRRNEARKDAFLASLADELSESLGPMRTSLHLRQTSGDVRSQARANQILETQLARQARLVQTLVDNSELHSGRVSLRLQPLDLRDVVTTVVQARSNDADDVELILTCGLPADAVNVTGDRSRLQQVLDRILDNSLRCTPAGGTVDVALSELDGHARLTVTDSGVGIDPSALPHLFEPFFKPSQEPARSLSGLGLGLSFVASLVKLHGGSVTIDSEGCGRGAVVDVRLPLASFAVV